MTTIELGEVTSSPGYEPAGGVDRRLARRLAVVAVTLLSLLTVTASARPPEDGLRRLWSVPMSEADAMLLGRQSVYLNRITAGRSRLTGYDLATGAARWEAVLDATTGDIELAEPAGLILMGADRQTGEHGGVVVEYHRATIALDTGTGRERWTVPGQVVRIDAATALLADHDTRGTIVRLRLLRLADQTITWSRETPGLYSYVALPGRIVTVTVNGRIEVLRFADGARLAESTVRWVTPKPEEDQFNDVTVAGDHILVINHRATRGGITAYRTDTLVEQWRGDYGDGYAFPCGNGVCSHDGDTVTSFDVATGTERWRRPGAGDAWLAGTDRVVAGTGGGDAMVMLDADTGRVLGEAVRTGVPVWTVDPAEDLYLMNPTVSPPGRTAIIRWELATGRSHLLGTVDLMTGYRCQTRGRYLACNRASRLEVTKVG